jgi:hypothetical protein
MEEDMLKLKRIFACSFILAVLPLFTSSIHDSNNPAPFATVAFAGHIVSGGGRYCDCGCPACICDPGEPRQVCEQSRTAPVTTDDPGFRSHSMTGGMDHSSLDFGSSALLLVLRVLLWARLRA